MNNPELNNNESTRLSATLLKQLGTLRPVNLRSSDPAAQNDTFTFCITLTSDHGQGDAFLEMVDDRNRPVHPDPMTATAPAAKVLEAIADTRADNDFSLGWEVADTRLSLFRYPAIADLLLDCRNVSVKGTGPVTSRHNDATMTIRLDREKDDAVETRRFQPVMLLDGEPFDINNIVSRRVVADGKSLRPVDDLGDNAAMLGIFTEPFATPMLLQWLSLFGTFVSGVTVQLDGTPVKWSGHRAGRIRSLVFKRIDPDRSLNLEVAHLLPGLDFALQTAVNLTAVAVEGADGRPVLMRSMPEDSGADADLIDNILHKCSPDRKATKMLYRERNSFIVPPEIAGPFLLQGLPQLLREFRIYGTERLREYKIQPAYPRLKVKFTSSGIDYLDTEAEVSVAGEQITLSDLLTQYRKERFVRLSDGTRAILDDTYMRRLQRIFRVRDTAAGKSVQVSYFDIPEIEALLDAPVKGEAPQHYRRFLEGFGALERESAECPGLTATLRPYQQEGVKWMDYLRRNNMGGVLADDMGLGKTVQTIALLCRVYASEEENTVAKENAGRNDSAGSTRVPPTLIVMPKSLIFNWQDELSRFAPGLKVSVFYGTGRSLDEAMVADIVLTTYGSMRSSIDELRRVRWEYVVLDESQNIKNLQSQTTRAAFLLQANHRMALSGTPMENNVTEIYSLFRFLNPTMLGSEADFNERYAQPIQVAADMDALAALRRKIFPVMLRRLKGDVLHDLPDITRQRIYVEMEPEQARLYEERRRYYKALLDNHIAEQGLGRSRMVMFRALNELRHIASVPESISEGTVKSCKIDPLVESISEAAANGHKCVVFFNFIVGIELVGERLDLLGIGYDTLTGSTNDRAGVIGHFRKNPDCKVLLLTVKVGGVGLNLTCADTVFIYEPWWNPAAERQAIDRLHRIGQKNHVSAYSMITRNTIEERILQLQERKAAIFDGLVTSDETFSKQLSKEDIEFMLS